MFEVGKKVIAIKDHGQGCVKKGHVYELLAIKKGCCDLWLDIGYKHHVPIDGLYCSKCGVTHNINQAWFASLYFAPYDDSLSTLTIDALLEIIEEEVIEH